MRLLLDEHLSPAPVAALAKLGVDAVALSTWQGGRYRESSDEVLLTAAASEKRILVTFDQRTIPPLLKGWAESGRAHAGVVFVDHRTIAPSAIGELARALAQLNERLGDLDWTDRTAYLRRALV